MPEQTVRGASCDMCGAESVTISYNTDLHEHFGLCTECGMPHRIYWSEEPGSIIVDTDNMIEPGDLDWDVISEYYEDTGYPAVLFSYNDFDESVVHKFEDWMAEHEEDFEIGDAIE